MIPSVVTNKISANAGSVVPSNNVAAIIAPCSGGSTFQNVPTTFNQPNVLQQAGKEGPLVDWGVYHMQTAKLGVLGVAPVCTTAASYGTIESTISGTISPVAGSASAIADDYLGVVVTFLTAGALGTAGITYQYSLDNGAMWSPVTALGTAVTLSLACPRTAADTGIRITLGTTTETVVKGDSFTFSVVGPRMALADLETSLEALRVCRQTWGDLLLVHGETSSAAVAVLDTWLAAQEEVGIFKTALVNTRFKNQKQGSTTTAETESAYATAIATVVNGASSIRVLAGADGGAMVSPVTAITKAAPTSLYVMTRAAQYSVGVMPEEQDLGPLPNCQIDDVNSNPLFHDEELYDTLDGLRLTTLRSDPNDPGVYIDNSNLLSAPGSDYVYLPYARAMNAACTVVYATLKNLLSQGIRVDLETGFILELQAAKWEGLCQKAAAAAVAGQVSGVLVTLSRTDNMSGQGPKTITVSVQVAGLKYVKTFVVNAAFVNTIAA